MRRGNTPPSVSSTGLSSGSGRMNSSVRLRVPSSAKCTRVLACSSSTSRRCRARCHRLLTCRLAYRRLKATSGCSGSPMCRPDSVSSRVKGLNLMLSRWAGTVARCSNCLLTRYRPSAGSNRKPSRAYRVTAVARLISRVFGLMRMDSTRLAWGIREYGTLCRKTGSAAGVRALLPPPCDWQQGEHMDTQALEPAGAGSACMASGLVIDLLDPVEGTAVIQTDFVGGAGNMIFEHIMHPLGQYRAVDHEAQLGIQVGRAWVEVE